MPIKLLIVIPCYNEEASLPLLLNELSSLVLPPEYQADIAVVNDCSKDKTHDVVLKHPSNIKVIDLPINLGIGGAVQTGLIYAVRNKYDLAIQMDGDGQHPPQELNKLLTCREISGANVVIGSRFLEREGFQSSSIRRIGIKYFHWLNRALTGQHIYDSTSGYRLFDRLALNLASKYYPDEYPEPESIILFSKAGLIVKETAVVMLGRNSGQSSIGKFASLYYCIKVTIAMVLSHVRKI